MLQCYLFAVCAGSSLDRDTNTTTLFSLLETIGIPETFLGQTVPVEVHAHFFVDATARNTPFEMRVIRVDAQGREDPGGALPFRTEDLPRMRVRVRLLRIPSAFGT